jgi:hypothetical protein
MVVTEHNSSHGTVDKPDVGNRWVLPSVDQILAENTPSSTSFCNCTSCGFADLFESNHQLENWVQEIYQPGSEGRARLALRP